MADYMIQPCETISPIDPAAGADGPVYLITANSEQGLEHRVVDVRHEASWAFPPRTVADRVVTDTASFVAELTRRPLIGGRSTLWGNRLAGTVTAVYDELDPAAIEDFTRREDRLILQFVPDPDWATFLKTADGQFHSQEDFGDRIESAGHLITSHPAAEVMEIVNSIRASRKGSFESHIQRDTGSQRLTYSEEVSAKAGSVSRPLEVPRQITMVTRPFEDYPQIAIGCWLRLKISQGQLHLGLFPQPYANAIRASWAKVVGDLAAAVGTPVYAANIK